jgi:thiol-disulfide isomerase/thioredoxin
VSRRIAFAVAALLLAPGLLAGCGRDQPASALVGVDTVSSQDRSDIPVIAGTTLDGDPLDVADLRGRIVVVNSWASWCPPCRQETPAFVELSKGVDPADVAVVGLNVTDDDVAARAFVEELDVPYPNIVDAKGDILATIPGVPPASLPSTVILDRDGRIAARVIGATDAMELATLIASIMGEEQSPAS